MLRRPAVSVAFALLLSLGLATPGFAATAESVLNDARDKYEERLKNVETITIVRDMMGTEMEHVLVKEMVNGRPALVAQSSSAGSNFGSVYEFVDEIAKQAELQGKEDIDGHKCWVVYVPRISDIDLGEEADDFAAEDGKLYFGVKDSLLRGMQMNGTMTQNGKSETMTMDIVLTDYREIDGWLQPFKTEMSLGGEAGSGQMAQMEAAMAEMKKQLEQMPAEQRAMMEKMMKDKMPKMSDGGGGSKMSMTMEVKEVRVNDAE